MQPPLSVEGLTKRFSTRGGSFSVLEGVHFEVRAGCITGLLGLNGAGKSTTIHCLTGLFPPTSGRVLISGTDVHREPKRARRELGVCFQEESVDTDLRVEDQLRFFASLFQIPAAVAARRTTALLAEFELTAKAKVGSSELSGGMRRKLQLATALISQPRLLLLDEPTSGLDPGSRRKFWRLLRAERDRGMAILLSTHHLEEAEALCDDVLFLHDGRIQAHETRTEKLRVHGHLHQMFFEITGGEENEP